MYIEYTEEKQCIKCKKTKPLTEYNDTVILTKRGDCKSCESDYTKAYYLANKQRIRENERIRRNRAKKDKSKENENTNRNSN